jgi:hypothetical protein
MHKSPNDDLAATGLQTLGSKVLLKQLKNLFDKTRFSQSLPEESDCSSIGKTIHHPKTDELLEGSSVIHLKFKLLITKVEQLFKHQYLEQDEGINAFLASVSIALLRVPLIQKRSKRLPRSLVR